MALGKATIRLCLPDKVGALLKTAEPANRSTPMDRTRSLREASHRQEQNLPTELIDLPKVNKTARSDARG